MRLLRQRSLSPRALARAQPRRGRQRIEALDLRWPRLQLPSQTARGDASRRRCAEPVGEPGDGLEHDENAVRVGQVERAPLHGRSAAADGPYCPDAHRGHQFTRCVQLPDRAVQRAAVAVTFGSEITRFWRLNEQAKRLKMPFCAPWKGAISQWGIAPPGNYRSSR